MSCLLSLNVVFVYMTTDFKSGGKPSQSVINVHAAEGHTASLAHFAGTEPMPLLYTLTALASELLQRP